MCSSELSVFSADRPRLGLENVPLSVSGSSSSTMIGTRVRFLGSVIMTTGSIPFEAAFYLGSSSSSFLAAASASSINLYFLTEDIFLSSSESACYKKRTRFPSLLANDSSALPSSSELGVTEPERFSRGFR
jgi:hypothetical protein